ncbi:MAG: Rpp14/Pop5 family protein [Candidatus Undinarchaeales archaeon]
MVKFKVRATQKETWRYIAFSVFSEAKPSKNNIIHTITSSILQLFGEAGASETNVWLIDYNKEKKKGILRCSNKALTEVLGALTAITSINKKKASVTTLGVSGTIKKLKKKHFN